MELADIPSKKSNILTESSAKTYDEIIKFLVGKPNPDEDFLIIPSQKTVHTSPPGKSPPPY